jgi:ABC-type uncharacterized transport system auxiliary subunit
MRLHSAILCSGLALSACSLSRPAPDAALYGLEPTRGSVQPGYERQPLRIANVRVSRSFAGSELVYRLDDVRFAQDYYNRFIAPPAPMLEASIAEWLARSGPFSIVQAGTPVSARFVLEATFLELYGDFREGRTPEAVMTVQFSIIDDSSSSPQVVFDKTISRRIPITQSSAPQLVRGYNVALGEILTELSSDSLLTAARSSITGFHKMPPNTQTVRR